MSQNFNILELETSVPIDERIEKYQYKRYVPDVGANMLNESGEIRFAIESQNVFIHPHNSYLYFKGQITKADGSGNFLDGSNITLINNGLMFLCTRIKYLLSGQNVENLQDPG